MTNITGEYLNYSKKHLNDYGKKTIVLLQVGAFYEMYGVKDKDDNIIGSNVEEVSKICDLQLSERSNMFYDNMPVFIAGFRDYSLDKYLQIITNHNYTCFVYDQFEYPDSKKFYRKLTNIYSKGTFFEENSDNLNNIIMGIWIHKISNKIIFGVSHINILTGQSYIFEYEEKYILSSTLVDNLERYLSIYRPNEIILVTNLSTEEYNKFKNIIHFETDNVRVIFTKNNEKFSLEARNCEKQTYIKDIINNIFKPSDYNSFIEYYIYNTISLQCYCFLLNWVSNHNASLLNRIEPPILEQTSEILHLANHSLKQLNIIGLDTKKNSSLLTLLNNCLTPMGKRLFSNLLVHPITNIVKLENEYNYIEKLLQNYDVVDFIRYSIRNIYDMEKYQRQLYLKKLSLRNIIRIYNNLISLNELYKYLKNNNEYVVNYIDNCDIIFKNCQNIIEFIERSINVNECKKNDNLSETTFNREYNEELDNLIDETKDNFENLEKIQNYIQNIFVAYEKKDTQYVKIYITDKTPPSLICTKKRSDIFKKHIEKTKEMKINDNITLDNNITFTKSASGNVSIEHSTIQKISQTYFNKKNILTKKIEDVFSIFLDEFKNYHDDYINITKFAANIDILQNKVYIAKNNNYNRPILKDTENSFVNIKGLRHPIIEKINLDELYVKNDINLNKERYGMLLFGTNAVGKTSFMKAIGISIIMAQSGLYVPCDYLELCPYKQMFTRILNNDNMFKGLSTFAVEMSELRVILQRADKNSIVLGDELCSGTEYESASSIFVSGIQWLENKQSTFIFATHLHNIVSFDEIINMKNVSCNHMSVYYDSYNDTLVYDRKLKDGSGDSIYGLEVCKSLHLPYDFLENAYEIRNKYMNKNNNLLTNNISRYNSKKILSTCEICNINPGTEIHHLIPQRNANEDNYIDHFHKNHVANLTSICENCHNKIHKDNYELKKIKTTKGYMFTLINNTL